jgi:DegV family protein with EDD domain
MKIVTDSAADMVSSELADLDIKQAPLFIQFPEGEVSSADITADEFYKRLEAMRPAIPTTAQPSGGIFAQLYSELAQVDQEILSIHISSGLSGTIQAARLGCEQVKGTANVTCWDTLTLSGGERFQVMAAALASRAGWTMEAIKERLAAIREHSEVTFTLETLEYLARGGRIGRVKALAGALLSLKPVIRVDTDGKYSTAATSRTINKALLAISSHLLKRYGQTPLWVTILHGSFADKAEELSVELKNHLQVAKIEVLRISPVLGVHTGPGVIGAAVVPMEWMADLL